MNELRITVDQVRRAYEITKLDPIACGWFDENCGCPQTALYLVHHEKDRSDKVTLGSKVAEWAARHYGREYADAFRAGFDCRTDRAGERRLRERVSGWMTDATVDAKRVYQAVEDGRACRAEFIEKPLAEASQIA
jgi:hypothetical protein